MGFEHTITVKLTLKVLSTSVNEMQLLPVIPRDGQQGVLVLFTESHGGQPVFGHVSVFPFTPTLDEMGTRIVDLEKNVVELMLQAGMKEQEISQQ